MNMSRSAKSTGLSCLGVVGIIFIVLKLLAVPPVASWSWIWVLCPFWIGLALDLVLIIIGLILIWIASR
jgi:hypothetical protein